MPLSLDLFPVVPPSRTALTSADIREYITNISWANFKAIETLLETVESQLNALPVTYRQASLPDSANSLDRWVDTSSGEQEKICTNPYTSGNGNSGDWTDLRDAATLAIANSAAGDAATAKLLNASDFPAAYTKDWLFVNTSTGAVYVCIETYDASFLGDKSTKYQALVDQSSSAAITSLQTQVDNFADDDIIASAEKRALELEWTQVQNNKTLGDSLATSLATTGSSEYIAMVAAYDALDTYLNTTLELFTDLNSDLSLVAQGSSRSTWNSTWSSWYQANQAYANSVSLLFNTDIDSIQGDETITQAEARDYEIRWDYEVQNYALHDEVTTNLDNSGVIDKSSNAEWSAYEAAYNAMNTYLNTTLDLFNNTTWPLVLSTKGSSATEWKQLWQDLSDTERAVSLLSNNAFAAQIDSLADDGTISKGGEKILANQGWNAIFGTDGLDGEYALLTNRANSLISAGNTTLTTPRDSLTLAYNDLKSYLDSLTSFYDTTVDTSVDNTTWDSKWNLYYTKYAALDKAASDIADSDIGLISGLVNDEAVTAGKEKQELIELFDQLTTEKNNMQTRASVGIGADTSGYITAYDDLKTFLYGLFADTGDGANFNNKDLGANSVNRSIWKQRFDEYYDQREALQTAIIQNNVTNLNRDSAAIPNMAVDGSITSEEKYVAKTYWNVIFGADALPDDDGEHDALETQATNLGVTQIYIDEFNDAFVRLWNFLTDDSHGAPNSETAVLNLFDDMGSPKALDVAQQAYWQQYWSDYYTKRDAITTQIQNQLQVNLDAKLERDGSLAMTGALDMGGFVISNAAQAAGAGQLVEYQQWIDRNAVVDNLLDQDVSLNAAPTFGANTRIGDNQISSSSIEIGSAGTGSRTSWVDFHAADTPGDYNARIIREAGANGSFNLVNFGTGNVNFDNPDGSDFVFNTNQYDSDFFVLGTSASNALMWDASANRLGVNDVSPDRTLDVNGDGQFSGGLFNTTIGSTNSIDGAAMQAGTIPLAALVGGGVDVEYVIEKDAETTNTGTDAVVVDATLTLPAGKEWKYVKIVIGMYLGQIQNIGTINEILVDGNDNTTNFGFIDQPVSTAGGENISHTIIAEGVPSVTDQDITIQVELSTAGDAAATNRRAYLVGIAG